MCLSYYFRVAHVTPDVEDGPLREELVAHVEMLGRIVALTVRVERRDMELLHNRV